MKSKTAIRERQRRSPADKRSAVRSSDGLAAVEHQCRMCGDKTDMPWTWPAANLCGECVRPLVVTRPGRKAHCVFGYSHEGLRVTYCGIRWGSLIQQARNEPHCKHCTKELRKAGMSWRWYEGQDREAANVALTDTAAKTKETQ